MSLEGAVEKGSDGFVSGNATINSLANSTLVEFLIPGSNTTVDGDAILIATGNDRLSANALQLRIYDSVASACTTLTDGELNIWSGSANSSLTTGILKFQGATSSTNSYLDATTLRISNTTANLYLSPLQALVQNSTFHTNIRQHYLTVNNVSLGTGTLLNSNHLEIKTTYPYVDLKETDTEAVRGIARIVHSAGHYRVEARDINENYKTALYQATKHSSSGLGIDHTFYTDNDQSRLYIANTYSTLNTATLEVRGSNYSVMRMNDLSTASTHRMVDFWNDSSQFHIQTRDSVGTFKSNDYVFSI